jgi:hypothetical protein
MSDFKVEHLANFGTGEPWVTRLMVDLPAIVDVTTLEKRDQVKEAFAASFRALVDSYNDLRELRRIESDPNVPLSEREGAYSAFYVHLWRAYKDRFQKEVPAALGYDIGFLWRSDNEFEAGVEQFLRNHPEVDTQLIDMMRDDRRIWQNKLALFRNEHLEHKRELDTAFVGTFYTLAGAELAFENVWRAIEDISVMLLVPHLAPGITLVEIAEAERDPAMPRRYGFAVAGLPE